MACHTLSESAKLTGKSRRTIQRYVKSGKLSAKVGTDGNPKVDTAELIRVFGELSHPVKEELSHPVTVTNNIEQIIAKSTEMLVDKIESLEAKIKGLTEEIKFLENRLEPPKENLSIEVEEASDDIQEVETITESYLYDIPVFTSKESRK